MLYYICHLLEHGIYDVLSISCCMQSELYPRLIQDVQLVINELGNVTVLWEELWLSTLQDLHTGMLTSLK
jgi:PI-3-kinase-related kinase SMG-1